MQNIRNIAIIAHVDHGKTTLVDKMLLAGNLFRGNQTSGELILDNNDLERERGITILSKNVSINYNGTKINIIDTPGHSDFGGEVERVLNMADGCILLVDAFEGPMPQTRFVLQKALEIGLKPIVVINKVDKPNCRPDEVHEMVFDLMFSLDATEEQLDFPTIYGSAKNNWMSTDWKEQTDSIVPLLDCIVENIPAPEQLEGTPQMLITSLDYSSYTGRIAVGRVHRGTLKEGMNVSLAKRDGSIVKSKIKEVHVFEGLGRNRVVGTGRDRSEKIVVETAEETQSAQDIRFGNQQQDRVAVEEGSAFQFVDEIAPSRRFIVVVTVLLPECFRIWRVLERSDDSTAIIPSLQRTPGIFFPFVFFADGFQSQGIVTRYGGEFVGVEGAGAVCAIEAVRFYFTAGKCRGEFVSSASYIAEVAV